MAFVFFIKQKTAYEMRISDWSSDVGSSPTFECWAVRSGAPERSRRCCVPLSGLDLFPATGEDPVEVSTIVDSREGSFRHCYIQEVAQPRPALTGRPDQQPVFRHLGSNLGDVFLIPRSEEHTSEL